MKPIVRKDDKRLEETTGKYKSRQALVAAVRHKVRVSKMSYKAVGAATGISDSTVTRILREDKSDYQKQELEQTGQSSRRLNQFWKIPSHNDPVYFARPHF